MKPQRYFLGKQWNVSFRSLLVLGLLVRVLECAAHAAVIDLQATGKASTGIILLSDIADIDDIDPNVQRQLELVSLGPAPATGKKVRMTQQMIRQRLLACGCNLSEIEFTGQSVVMIESAMAEDAAQAAKNRSTKPQPLRPIFISPAQKKKAEEVVLRAFHRQYHGVASDVGPLQLTVEIADDDIPLLLDAEPHLIQFVEQGLEWGGPQKLTTHFAQREGSTRVIHLQAWLNDTPQILTVKHTVPRGKVIQEHDLTYIAAKNGETGLGDKKHVVGQEATRDLRPGHPLQKQDSASVPLVKSNDLVTVKVRSPGLTVTRLCRALGNGAAGDTVNLTPLENPQERLLATVTGWHEAEITGSPDSDGPPPAASTVPHPTSRKRRRPAPVVENNSWQGGQP